VDFIDFFFQQTGQHRAEHGPSSESAELTIQNWATPLARKTSAPTDSPSLTFVRPSRHVASETFDYSNRDDATLNEVSVEGSAYSYSTKEWDRHRAAMPAAYVPTAPANSPDCGTYDSSVRRADSSDYALDEPSGSRRLRDCNQYDGDSTSSSDPIPPVSARRATRELDPVTVRRKRIQLSGYTRSISRQHLPVRTQQVSVRTQDVPVRTRHIPVRTQTASRVHSRASTRTAYPVKSRYSPRLVFSRCPVPVVDNGTLRRTEVSPCSSRSFVDDVKCSDTDDSDLLVSPNGPPDLVPQQVRGPAAEMRTHLSRPHTSGTFTRVGSFARHRYSGSVNDYR